MQQLLFQMQNEVTVLYLLSVLGLLDIPVYKSRIESLHLVFSLYMEFKNSQVCYHIRKYKWIEFTVTSYCWHRAVKYREKEAGQSLAVCETFGVCSCL